MLLKRRPYLLFLIIKGLMRQAQVAVLKCDVMKTQGIIIQIKIGYHILSHVEDLNAVPVLKMLLRKIGAEDIIGAVGDHHVIMLL